MPPRSEKSGDAPSKPREDTLGEESPYRDYPPLGTYDCLIAWAAEAGWCRWSEGGAQPLTWQEIATWAGLTCTPLGPWEAQALRAISAAYAGGANAAREPSCRPVWPPLEEIEAEERERERERARNSIKAAFRGGMVSDGDSD